MVSGKKAPLLAVAESDNGTCIAQDTPGQVTRWSNNIDWMMGLELWMVQPCYDESQSIGKLCSEGKVSDDIC